MFESNAIVNTGAACESEPRVNLREAISGSADAVRAILGVESGILIFLNGRPRDLIEDRKPNSFAEVTMGLHNDLNTALNALNEIASILGA